jgi:hypothetical protein
MGAGRLGSSAVRVALYAHELIVCNDQLNWPDPDRVRGINDAMYVQSQPADWGRSAA